MEMKIVPGETETAGLHFDLPAELIATYPPRRRGDSRLLVVTPGKHPGAPFLEDRQFRELPELLRADDLLIANNTRVSHRRLTLQRQTGGRIEALFLHPLPDATWLCLLRGLKKLRSGERLRLAEPPRLASADTAASDRFAGDPTAIQFEFCGTAPGQTTPDARSGPTTGPVEGPAHGILRPILTTAPDSSAWPDLATAENFFARYGQVPIPPYLGREAQPLDQERYQTIYARHPASVAAPTAGLHFTDSIIEEIEKRGARFRSLELRIGYGTFAPLGPANFEQNRLHTESYELPAGLALELNAAPKGRRLAAGTTALRALEANYRAFGQYRPGLFATDLFLRPPAQVTTIDALITNFHLPGSSLLMLVACVLDPADVLTAYRHAIKERYRFFSYGDAMLLCRQAFST